MSYSVIIPSRTQSNLTACVRAIRQAREMCRIIVVDDFDATHALETPYPSPSPVVRVPLPHRTAVEDYGPIRWEVGERPFIFARNCNTGMVAAGEDDVILLNDDALLKSPLGFETLALAARSNPDYGIIAAVTNLTGQPLQQPRFEGLREVPHIAFVCVYIPRRTIRRVGMLDERYCLDYGVEDRDYCEAVHRHGLKIGVHDFCYVDHSSLQSSYRGAPMSGRSFAQNYALFKEKWGVKE